MRMSELADGVLISRSGLTRLVDRIERAGLLRRERCEEDARGWFAAITDDGRELFRRARETHLAGVRKLFLSRFSREELRTLGALWEKLEAGQTPRSRASSCPATKTRERDRGRGRTP